MPLVHVNINQKEVFAMATLAGAADCAFFSFFVSSSVTKGITTGTTPAAVA
jgi:hypothetical protein